MRTAKVSSTLLGTNMMPTMPIPDDLRKKEIALSDNSRVVLEKRYLRRGTDGKPAENIHEMFWRVAYHVALAEKELGADDKGIEKSARRFFELLTGLQFFPNSPTFTGAGTPLGQLAACFTADMRVTTSTGLKPIAELQPGDLVLTHMGRYMPVKEAYKREYKGKLLTVSVGTRQTPLRVTPEHPIWVWSEEEHGYIWVKAGDLKVKDEVVIGHLVPELAISNSLPVREWGDFVGSLSNYDALPTADEYDFVSDIKSEHFDGYVYNCEVEEDHTYVTEGVVVHNCFVLAIEDDMGRSESGIFQTLRNAALIQQTGGGNGFSFSRLRPKGAIVQSSRGEATGPVGFLRVYDQAFGEIAQGGSRRGANMAVLRVDHPDIREFIASKSDESKITNFNISIGITDLFMRKVEEDGDFDLINPQDGKVWETVRARELFDMIVKYAHNNGEPGVLFLDAANRANPVPHLYELESTNPCVTGETLVATPSGWRRVDSIHEGDEICTVLGTGRVQTVEINENMPVYKMTLSDGGTIRVTASHQFHVRDTKTKFFGNKRTDEIKIGDWVRVYETAIPNNPVPQGNCVLEDRHYGFLVGALVSNGTDTPLTVPIGTMSISVDGNVSFDSPKPKVLMRPAGDSNLQTKDSVWYNILLESFSAVSAHPDLQQTGYIPPLKSKAGYDITEWVKSIPLTPSHGHEKSLPDVFINSNEQFLRGLIDGLFSTDGSVDLSSNHPLVRFHTSSVVLAEQVRQILLMFGIHGRINKSVRKRHDINGRVIRHDRAKYDIVIVGESFGRFYKQFKLTHPDKQARMEQAALLCNFTGGNWAAKVISIEPDGVETVYDLYESKSDTWITNGYVSRGCGEQYLGPFENCCLGSINLAKLSLKDGKPDWEMLQEWTEASTRFLDDVVTANSYVPGVPQLAQAAHRIRRIGLGIMGLADLMYKLNVRYGSEEGQEFAGQLMEFVRYHCMKTSVELAKERGAFPAIEGSIYDPKDLKWQPPTPLFPYTRNWKRPALNWDKIVNGIKKHGIRNGAQTTVAPTGTIATVSGCEGYGCEPVFALAYIRHVNDKGQDLQLQYTSPLFETALSKANLSEDQIKRIIDQVNMEGTCQNVKELPDTLRHTFVVSSDVTAHEHIRMQAAMQRFVDNAISKTCNFPPNTSVADVAEAYMLGWKLGAKGLTVYVTGSRDKVVLETHATAKAKEEAPVEAIEAEVEAEIATEMTTEADTALVTAQSYPVRSDEEQITLYPTYKDTKKGRPRRLVGRTYRIGTPLGTTFVTINENGEGAGQPFELFIHTSKAGSDTAAVSEAIGRLASLVLRLRSPIMPRERLKEIMVQLEGIGGGRPTGFGAARVRSLPDGVAQILSDYMEETEAELAEGIVTHDPQMSYLNGGTNGNGNGHAVSATAPVVTAANGNGGNSTPKASTAISTDAAPGGAVKFTGVQVGDLCPECGAATLINEEGCRKCYSCGYSEC